VARHSGAMESETQLAPNNTARTGDAFSGTHAMSQAPEGIPALDKVLVLIEGHPAQITGLGEILAPVPVKT
jgi:hypothetical protein